MYTYLCKPFVSYIYHGFLHISSFLGLLASSSFLLVSYTVEDLEKSPNLNIIKVINGWLVFNQCMCNLNKKRSWSRTITWFAGHMNY